MSLWLADLAVRATLLLAVTAMLALMLRRRPAAVRHTIWLAALGGVLILPAAALVLPRVDVPVPSILVEPSVAKRSANSWTPAPLEVLPTNVDADDPFADVQSRRLEIRHLEGTATIEDADASAQSVEPLAWRPSPGQWLSAIWLIGAGLLFARLMAGLMITRRLAQAATPLRASHALNVLDEVRETLDIRRPIRLLASAQTAVPITWGWRRPIILVPSAAEQWTSARWRVVLLHEGTHVRRRDWLSQLLSQAVCIAHWFNPVVWLSAWRLKLEGERACDECVLDAGTRASDYAEHLLDIARVARPIDWTAPATVGLARRGQLERRLMDILRPSRHSSPVSSGGGHQRPALAAVATIAIVVAILSALQPSIEAGQAAQPVPAPVAPDARAAAAAPAPLAPARAAAVTVPARPERPVRPAPAPAQREQTSRPVIAERLEEQARERAERVRELTHVDVNELREQVERVRVKIEAMPSPLRERPFRFDRGDFAVQVPPIPPVPPAPPAPPAPAAPIEPRIADAFIGALSDTEPEVREEAARVLGLYRVERAAGALARALEDEVPDVREEVARALGRIRSTDALRGLVGALDDPEIDVREAAIDALAALRSPEAVPGLIQALKDPNADIGERAARALGSIRDPQAIDPLLGATRHPEPDVVQAAIRALGMFSDSRAIDALTSAMKHENPAVRRAAMQSLSRSRFVTVECRDGVDNDGDTLVDAADSDCR